jgi:LPXTG-motif cell wall-anchored protein
LSSNRHTLLRLGLAAAVGCVTTLAMAAAGNAVPGGTTTPPIVPQQSVLKGDHCVSAAHARYWHTFKVDLARHTAEADIWVRDASLCAGQAQPFTLVSYLAPGATFAVPQYVFDQETVTVTRGNAGFHLQVDVPDCYTQVDFIFGGADRVINPITTEADRYGNDKVGSDGAPGNRSKPTGDMWPKHAWFNGGTTACQTTPAVQSVPHCDGSTTLNLQNGRDAADTTYIITGDGGYRREVTIARGGNPVAQVEVPATAAAHLTVSSGGTVIKVVDWVRPTDCQQVTYTWTSDCLTSSVTIANPAGNTTAVVTILRVGDGSTETVTVEPGTSRVVPEGVGVRVSFTTFGATTILDLARPATCASVPPSTPAPSSSASAPVLPVTGANVAAVGGVAGVLLLAGGCLFLVARRRRVSFKA